MGNHPARDGGAKSVAPDDDGAVKETAPQREPDRTPGDSGAPKKKRGDVSPEEMKQLEHDVAAAVATGDGSGMSSSDESPKPIRKPRVRFPKGTNPRPRQSAIRCFRQR